MDANSRKKPNQLEINDLIAEAVVNAEARRNQAEEFLSDEQAAAVKGGAISLERVVRSPILCGIIQCDDNLSLISHATSQDNF
jgi:hypothetical protein